MSRRFDIALFCVAVLALWELLFLRVGDSGIASPLATFMKIGELFGSQSFWFNVSSTATAFGLAVVIAVVCGTAIGLLLGVFADAGEVADPILNALSAIPKITLYPVILLFFGLGLSAKVAFGTIHGIFPIIILTMTGIRSIPAAVLKTARSMRLSKLETARTILLPAALPEMFSGLRIGVALALLGTIIGEMFASDRGVGFMLMQGFEQQHTANIMALTVLMFAVAVSGGIGLLALDKRLHGDRA